MAYKKFLPIGYGNDYIIIALNSQNVVQKAYVSAIICSFVGLCSTWPYELVTSNPPLNTISIVLKYKLTLVLLHRK